MSRITTRLKIIKGESLSGYLIRTSRVNGIKPQRLFNYICKELNIETNNIRSWSSIGYKLDLYPEVIMDINNLEKLVVKSLSSLRGLTLRSVFRKFFDNPIEYKTVSGTGIFRYNRFFCPECLKQYGVYMLHWQIRDIEVCHKHLIKLRSNCPMCHKEQPYVTDKLAYYRCVYCNSLLFDENQTEVKLDDSEMIIKEKRKLEDWVFLINPNTTLFSTIKQFGERKSLVILSLFIDQCMRETFTTLAIDFFDKKSVYVMLHFIRGNAKNPSFSIISFLQLIRYKGLRINEISYIDVPPKFVDSLYKKNAKETGPCLSQWCQYYLSGKMIQQIEERYCRQKSHLKVSVCTGCFMTFGYNKKHNQWEMIDNKIAKYLSTVKQMIESERSNYYIRTELNLSNNDVNWIITYLINHQLISSKYVEKYNIPIIPEDILNYFDVLIYTEGEMKKNAKKIFKWGRFQFYYYYTLPQVQKYLLLEVNVTRRVSKGKGYKKEMITDKIITIMEQLMNDGISINHNEIALRLNMSTAILSFYNIGNIIREFKHIQKNKKLCEQQKELRDSITNFLNDRKLIKQRILKKEVYDYIKIKQRWIEYNIPQLNTFIRDALTKCNKQIMLSIMKDNKNKIRENIIEYSKQGINLTIRKLEGMLGKPEDYIHKNKELKDFVIRIKNEFCNKY